VVLWVPTLGMAAMIAAGMQSTQRHPPWPRLRLAILGAGNVGAHLGWGCSLPSFQSRKFLSDRSKACCLATDTDRAPAFGCEMAPLCRFLFLSLAPLPIHVAPHLHPVNESVGKLDGPRMSSQRKLTGDDSERTVAGDTRANSFEAGRRIGKRRAHPSNRRSSS